MTHATQLALMVVWLGIDPDQVSPEDREEIWRRMGGLSDVTDDDPVGSAWSACAARCEADLVTSTIITTHFPSCPACCVLLDMAREVAP